jgi:hypothetical protein
MTPEREKRLRQLAKVRACDNTLLSLRMQNAALIANQMGVTRDDFLGIAGIWFDGIGQMQTRDAEEQFTRMSAALEGGDAEAKDGVR